MIPVTLIMNHDPDHPVRPRPKSDVLTLQWLQQLTVVLANLFLQSIPLPFLALLLAAFVCFTFRLRDENINGPEEPASELVRDFFPTGFK